MTRPGSGKATVASKGAAASTGSAQTTDTAAPIAGTSAGPTSARPSWGTRACYAAAWTGAAIALLACYVKISYGARIDADGANIALQGWDFIHGHLVMHGWLPGDATYYGYEVPILGVAELVFGLGVRAAHVASGLAYLFVTVFAVALAVAGARGTGRAARAGAVVAIMAAPLLTITTVWTMLEEPDHPGSAVFVLVPALLIDRVVDRLPGGLPGGRKLGRRLVPPVMCLVLCVGQISDATTKYVVIPALVVVCAWRLLAAARAGSGQGGGSPRWYRSFDAALGIAALVSIPLEYAVHAVLLALGGYQAVTPHNKIASPSLWPGHVVTTWLVVRELFGAVPTSWTSLGDIGAAFGWLCLLATLAGLVRVAWTWRRARWAEQFLAVTIVVFFVVYAVSAMAQADGYREISEILPCGAVLAARTLVPSRLLTGRLVKGWGVLAVAVAAAIFPLAVAASRPVVGPALGPAPGNGASTATVSLTSWLEAHGLSYGLSDYWSSSTVTLQSGNRVRLRAITMVPTTGSTAGYVPHAPYWETNALWYDPARDDATFVVARDGHYAAAVYEALFGKPVATYRVSVWTILDYQRNLLPQLPPMLGVGVGPKS